MKNVTAIIIEDNLEDANEIENLIEKQCPNIRILGIGLDPMESKKILHNTQYDIVILGIKSGMDYAFEMLQNAPYKITDKKLILISTEKERQLQLIADTTIDFIERPLEARNIIDTIEKAKKSVVDNSSTVPISLSDNIVSKPLNLLAIPSVDEVKIIKVNEILYLQSEGKYTSFYTTKGKEIVSSINLGTYEKKLMKNNFFRIHNSFLVNMDNIINVQKRDGVYVEMNNRAMIPVAKRKKDPLFHYLGLK